MPQGRFIPAAQLITNTADVEHCNGSQVQQRQVFFEFATSNVHVLFSGVQVMSTAHYLHISADHAAFVGCHFLRGCTKKALLRSSLPVQVRDRANISIKLSAMVLNHQVAKIVLLEQVYRAWTILNGEPYHH